MGACYPFLKIREEMGSVIKENKKMKKRRGQKHKIQEKQDMVTKCLEDAKTDTTLECSGKMAEFDDMMEKAKELAPTDVAVPQGETPEVIKLPADCKSETDCNYICTKFVDAKGATNEAETQSGLSDTSTRLLQETVTLEFTEGGYQADADIHSSGDLAEAVTFSETVDIAGIMSKPSAFILALTTLILALVQ